MWKWISAVLAGAASAGLAAVLGYFQTVDTSGITGTDPLKIAIAGAAVAAIVRLVNFLVSKL